MREWNRRGRSLTSGGLDSYTNVSSESEELASSTALATLASNISAFDDARRFLISIELGLRDSIERRSGLVARLLVGENGP